MWTSGISRDGTLASRAASCRLAAKELPCPLDVPRLRSKVADRDPDREPTVQPGVREEDLAGPVDGVHDGRVVVVRARNPSEADRRERHGRHQLPVRIVPDPPRERLGQLDVTLDPSAQPVEAEPAKLDPQLQGTEAAAELGRV